MNLITFLFNLSVFRSVFHFLILQFIICFQFNSTQFLHNVSSCFQIPSLIPKSTDFPINKFKSFIISRALDVDCRISPALMCSKICPFMACFTERSVVLFELDNVEGK